MRRHMKTTFCTYFYSPEVAKVLLLATMFLFFLFFWLRFARKPDKRSRVLSIT